MVRFVAFDLVLFFLPFGAYALWLYVTRQTVGGAAEWETRTIAWLALTGAALFVLTIAVFIHFDTGAPGGRYVPAHVENGEIVPGHIDAPTGPFQ